MKKVIKFYADFCGPCKVYAKTFDKVKEAHKDTIEFLEIDIENDPEGLSAEHKVRSIPHTVVIQEDGTITSKTGRISKEDLEELILS